MLQLHCPKMLSLKKMLWESKCLHDCVPSGYMNLKARIRPSVWQLNILCSGSPCGSVLNDLEGPDRKVGSCPMSPSQATTVKSVSKALNLLCSIVQFLLLKASSSIANKGLFNTTTLDYKECSGKEHVRTRVKFSKRQCGFSELDRPGSFKGLGNCLQSLGVITWEILD